MAEIRRTLIPQFSLRFILAVTALAAVAAFIVSLAVPRLCLGGWHFGRPADVGGNITCLRGSFPSRRAFGGIIRPLACPREAEPFATHAGRLKRRHAARATPHHYSSRDHKRRSSQFRRQHHAPGFSPQSDQHDRPATHPQHQLDRFLRLSPRANLGEIHGRPTRRRPFASHSFPTPPRLYQRR